MRGIKFGVDDSSEDYLYKKRTVSVKGGKCAYAQIPQITTRVELCADSTEYAEAVEGELFVPYYTLMLHRKINGTEVTKAWLKLKKM